MKPLPRGRHGLSREFVAANQRGRLVAAIAAELDEVGYEGATVATVAGRAGISKSDFYAHFASKQECILVAYDDAVERLRGEVLAACEGGEEWGESVCAGVAAMLAGLSAAPAQANLLLVEGLRAGPAICARYRGAVESFAPYLHAAGPVAGGAGEPPREAGEVVVGGIASLLARRVAAGEADRLDRFFPELAEFALSPYLDVAEARRIISSI